MAVNSYDELRPHIGHKITCVCYGSEGEDPANIAIECEDCNEVLVSFDKEDSIEEILNTQKRKRTKRNVNREKED